MARSSAGGNHQFARPVGCSTAGVATMRTNVASSRTATATPSPMTRSTRRSPRTNAAKTQIMMAAAEVMIRPVLASALATASESDTTAPVSMAPARHSSLIRETRKTWSSMENPNSRANSISGIHGSTGAVAPLSMPPPSQPHWNTTTITP